LLVKTKQKIKTQSLPEPGCRRVWVGAESLPKNKNRKCKKRKEVGKGRDGGGRGVVSFWVRQGDRGGGRERGRKKDGEGGCGGGFFKYKLG
jgi:hypothetical protein